MSMCCFIKTKNANFQMICSQPLTLSVCTFLFLSCSYFIFPLFLILAFKPRDNSAVSIKRRRTVQRSSTRRYQSLHCRPTKTMVEINQGKSIVAVKKLKSKYDTNKHVLFLCMIVEWMITTKDEKAANIAQMSICQISAFFSYCREMGQES